MTIDMFRAAGLGAAVGNAVSALKEEADYVSHEKMGLRCYRSTGSFKSTAAVP